MNQIASNPALRAAAVYVALLTLLAVPLVFNVIRLRRSLKVGLQDGGNKDLARAIRVHGNFTETAPFAIALLLALPLAGASAWIVHAVGLATLVGRVAHAIGLSQSAGASLGRVAGMLLSLAALIVGSIALLAAALG